MSIEHKLKLKILDCIKSSSNEDEVESIRQLAREAGVDHVLIASALLKILTQDQNIENSKEEEFSQSDNSESAKTQEILISDEPKMIRYRVEVGRRHSVSKDEIKNALVEESGVDVKMIGSIEMHQHFTFVELPDGMPPDIYHHLKSVEINHHKLYIKQANSHARNKKRFNAKRRSGKRRSPQNRNQSRVAESANKIAQ